MKKAQLLPMNDQLKITIHAFAQLGEYLSTKPEELKDIVIVAKHHNGWFDESSSWEAIESISNHFLNQRKLEDFTSTYTIPTSVQKKVGLILAGNIPLVGFHDILCVLLSGHIAVIKLSSKDDKLTRAVLMKLVQIEPRLKERVQIVERIKDIDAVIATGSDNSAKYFEQYFGKYPNIIRKNRTSIAVLTGNETKEDFEKLGKDIYQYFGLGCRNVSKLFIPKNYNFNSLIESLNENNSALNNQKYKNNFDYNLTLFLINSIPFLQGDSIIFTEDEALHSRIGVIHYQEYTSINEVNDYIIENKNQLQVIIGKDFEPFGSSQSPSLNDFADRVDTMKFLSAL